MTFYVDEKTVECLSEVQEKMRKFGVSDKKVSCLSNANTAEERLKALADAANSVELSINGYIAKIDADSEDKDQRHFIRVQMGYQRAFNCTWRPNYFWYHNESLLCPDPLVSSVLEALRYIETEVEPFHYLIIHTDYGDGKPPRVSVEKLGVGFDSTLADSKKHANRYAGYLAPPTTWTIPKVEIASISGVSDVTEAFNEIVERTLRRRYWFKTFINKIASLFRKKQNG